MKKFVLLLTVTLTLLSCQKQAITGIQGDEPQTPVQLWPLKIGNSWTYERRDFKWDGSIEQTFTYKMLVADTATYDNQLYFIIKTEGMPGTIDVPVRSTETEAFVYIMEESKELRVAKWPATNGEIIYTNHNDYGYDTTTISTEPVMINNFKSYAFTSKHYDSPSITVPDSSISYFQPGLGITGSLDFSLSTGQYRKSEETKLLSYELK